ncbi:hypothetical protein EUGRSUZ_G00309 [Eucalyptus grandis]|uniref:Uncharacterized protein n=2 Tax=Eucalyptus grandis TaxID=71139 RepID=A0A059B9K6_EUCGR|nr:hypothetical protein EUGRSUZ_G00309 [Eucalyptus grandis]
MGKTKARVLPWYNSHSEQGTADQISPIVDVIKRHGVNGKQRLDTIVLQLQPQAVRDPEIQHSVGVSPHEPPHYRRHSTPPSSFSSSSPSSSRGQPAWSWSRSCLPRRPLAALAPSSSSPSSHPLMLRELQLLGFGAFAATLLFLLVLLVRRRRRREATIGLELDLRLHLLLFALAFGVLRG